MTGWISIHRKIKDHWLWEDKPFSKGQAWIDLLMMVNHKDNKTLLGNELIEVKRGSRITSIRQLCDRWGWSNTKVRRFLKVLEGEEMLIVKSDTKKTTLTIVNYNDYQLSSDSENTTETSQKHHENDTETSQKHTNNNDNNDNNSLFMYSEELKKVVNLLENNIGVIPPILIEEVSNYSKTFSNDMFSEAIKIAANNKKRTINYVLGILRNWKDNNILNISDLEALRKEKELERENKKQSKQESKQSYQHKKTRFHNFKSRTDKYTPDEINARIEEISKQKRQEYLERLKQGEENDNEKKC